MNHIDIDRSFEPAFVSAEGVQSLCHVQSYKIPAIFNVTGKSETEKMNKDKWTKLSRFLSFVLRHKPQDIGLKLDENAWADVDELIKAVNHSGHFLTLDMLREIVATDEKERYAFSAGGTKIRASQGHSIKSKSSKSFWH